jgi:hypothetical protein
MLLTPTFVGLLLAGAAFWTLIWAAIHKLDEIPYLKEFTSSAIWTTYSLLPYRRTTKFNGIVSRNNFLCDFRRWRSDCDL